MSLSVGGESFRRWCHRPHLFSSEVAGPLGLAHLQATLASWVVAPPAFCARRPLPNAEARPMLHRNHGLPHQQAVATQQV